MNISEQSWNFEDTIDGMSILQKLERAGRVCYRSEDKITDTSCIPFLRDKIKKGHYSLIEHVSITVRAITDRGVTHEIVRHRLASYSQESTRYCRYDGSRDGLSIRFITPVDFELVQKDYDLLRKIEEHYNWCLSIGRLPQQARYFLPNGLKTEIIMTYNIREWRHFFTLRCSKAAHPQMQALALSMLKGFHAAIPVLFEDLAEQYL